MYALSFLGPNVQKQTPRGKPGVKLEVESLRPRPRKHMGGMGIGDRKLVMRTIRTKCLNLFLPATSR